MALPYNEKSFLNDFPQLLNMWDFERNTRDNISINLTKNSHKKSHWKCPVKGCHRWIASVGNMVGGIKKRKKEKSNGCPVCSGRNICEDGCCNSLYSFSQLLRDEWDPENKQDMKEFTLGSKEEVGWICKIIPHHKWVCAIYSRTWHDTGCPFCAGKPCNLCDGTCNTLYGAASEELKSRWIESMNGSMKNYSPMSSKKTWWCCPTYPHHIMKQSVYTMMKDNVKCPICTNHKLCWCLCNSVACKAPDIIKQEWDPINPPMEDIIAGGEKLRWWRCRIKPCHRWQDKLCDRLGPKQKGCPCCTNKRICPTDACNSLFFFADEILKQE